MEEKSIGGLDSTERWGVSQGQPQDYFIDATTQTRLGLVPWPTVSSTGTLTVTYYSQADDLVNGADIPFNNYRKFHAFHYLLTLYAAYRGWMIYGDISIAKFYYEEYSLGVERMRGLINFGPNFNPSFKGDRGK